MVPLVPLLTSLRIAKASTLVGFALWAFMTAGCAGAEPPPFINKPPKGSGGEGGEQGMGGAPDDGSGGRSSGCKEDAQQECTIYVQQANGVTSCWSGLKFCVDGSWTECLDTGSAPATQGER